MVFSASACDGLKCLYQFSSHFQAYHIQDAQEPVLRLKGWDPRLVRAILAPDRSSPADEQKSGDQISGHMVMPWLCRNVL